MRLEDAHDVQIVCAAVMPMHRLQDRVAAALDRKMQMRTKLFILQQALDIIRVDHRRLQRAEPDTKVSVQSVQPADDDLDAMHPCRLLRSRQRISESLLGIVECCIDAGQHQLPEPMCKQRLCLQHDLLRSRLRTCPRANGIRQYEQNLLQPSWILI